MTIEETKNIIRWDPRVFDATVEYDHYILVWLRVGICYEGDHKPLFNYNFHDVESIVSKIKFCYCRECKIKIVELTIKCNGENRNRWRDYLEGWEDGLKTIDTV